MVVEYISIGITGIAIAFVIFFFLSLYVYTPFVTRKIEDFQGFLVTPVISLWGKIKSLIQKRTHLAPSNTLNDKFSVFSDFSGFLTFVLVALLTLVLSFFVFDNIQSGTELFLLALENTTMGACMLSISNQTLTTITASLVMATGFSAAFSSFCMKAVSSKTHSKDKKDNPGEETAVVPTEDSAEKPVAEFSEEITSPDAKWYIKAAMFLISFVAMIVLTIVLKDIFESVGNWGYRTITDLYHVRGQGFFNIVGRIIALLFLGYAALLLILSVVAQYLTYLAYFPLFLAAFGGIATGIERLILTHSAESKFTSDIIVVTVLFILVFGVELLKAKDEGLRRKIRPHFTRVWLKIIKGSWKFFKFIGRLIVRLVIWG